MKTLSRYTYEVKDPESPADELGTTTLLYNTFSDCLAQVPRPLWNALNSKDNTNLSLYPTELRELEEQGIVVEDTVDEKRELKNWYREFITQKDALEVTVLLSYRCNFACPYCFESKVLGNVRMQAEVEEGLLDWIEGQLITKNIPKLHVVFFGGEPLVEKELLYRLASSMRNLTTALNAQFEFTLITNGYHLTRPVYERLKDLGLVHVKVTLDGDKETHDKSRPLKGGRGSFEGILKNLRDIGVLTSFTLGGNYDESDPDQVSSISKLLDRLDSEGLADSVGRFAFKPKLDAKLEATDSFIASIGDKPMTTYLQIEERLKQKKLPSSRRVILGPCDALKHHSMAIDPKGDIYPCGAFAGDQRACIGNVLTGWNDRYDEIMGYDATDNEQCDSCTHLPACFGGCRWVALLQEGHYRAPRCQKPYFEQTVPSLLVMESRQSFSV